MANHKSKAELLNTLPEDTGSATGQPTGVKGIADTEQVDAARHNRSVGSAMANLDVHDFQLRNELASPAYLDVTPTAGKIELSGRIYTGESTGQDHPEDIMRFFRITDKTNQPVFVDGRMVVVTDVKDPAAAAVIGVKRQLLNGATSVTFERQTITHAEASLAFTYMQPGDELVVTGGVNPGTYIIEEVVSGFEVRVRNTAGVEAAFTATTESVTLTGRTNGYFQHKKDAGETFDVELTLSDTIAYEIRAHYFVGLMTRSLSRNMVSEITKEDRSKDSTPADLQRLYNNALRGQGIGSPSTRRLISAGDGAMEMVTPAATDDPYGAALRLKKNVGVDPGHSVYQHLEGLRDGGQNASLLSTIGARSQLVEMYTGDGGDYVIRNSNLAYDADDMTNVGGGIVESLVVNFSTLAKIGQTIWIQGATGGYDDPDEFLITEVAPGSNNNRLRIAPTPTFTGPKDYAVYDARYQWQVDPPIIPYQTLCLVAPKFSAAGTGGTLAEDSDVLTDATKNFTALEVKIGDIVFVHGSGLNVGKYTVLAVAPGADTTKLQLNKAALAADTSVDYTVIPQDILYNRACVVVAVKPHELGVAPLGSFDGAWIASDRNVYVSFMHSSVLIDNYMEDSVGNSPVLEHGQLVVHQTETDVPSAGLTEGVKLVATSYDAEDPDDYPILSGRTFIKFAAPAAPGSIPDGLIAVPGSDLARFENLTSDMVTALRMKVGQRIIPTSPIVDEVKTITELLSSNFVRVNSAYSDETPDSGTNRTPFYLDDAMPFKLYPSGKLRARDIALIQEVERRLPIGYTKVHPLTGYTGGLATGTTGHGWKNSTAGSAFVHIPLDEVQPGDKIIAVATRIELATALGDPLAVVNHQLYEQPLNDDGASTAYTGGVGASGLPGSDYTFTGSNPIVTKAGGGFLAANVRPGMFVRTEAGSGSDEQAEILGVKSDTELIVSRSHSLAVPGTTNGRVQDGKILEAIPASLTSKFWEFIVVFDTPITVLADHVYTYELELPAVNDLVMGSELRIKTTRVI